MDNTKTGNVSLTVSQMSGGYLKGDRTRIVEGPLRRLLLLRAAQPLLRRSC